MTFEDVIFEEMNGHSVEEDKIFVKGYNQALKDLLAKVKTNHYLLSDKINSTDYGMFTCGIEKAIAELKR